MKKSLLFLLLAIYFLLSIFTLLAWTDNERNLITGDEPHYLVVANGIVQHKTFEQTAPYQEIFERKNIGKIGFDVRGGAPSPHNTHAVHGPHGLFSIHNIGLPLLLAMPFFIGGIIGAKIAMIFLNSFLIIISWKMTAILTARNRLRFLIILVVCIAFPFIPASNQIFPDMFAGIISLGALYFFMTTNKKRAFWKELFFISGVAFLPWLQIKLSLTATLLLLAILLRKWVQLKKIRPIIFFAAVFIFSFCLLAFYNMYAFGKISGPYANNALEISKTSFMVFFGLLLDQNQGIFMQNLIAWVGIAFIGNFYRQYKYPALLSGVVFLSLIAPNALHPNWYGGWSFSGRFEWSAAIVFMPFTLFGLIMLATYRKIFFRVIISISILWQIYLFYRYTLQGPGLYNKSPSTDFSHYSTFYGKINDWLPALYNSDWAFYYIPNYVWSAILIWLLIFSFRKNK